MKLLEMKKRIMNYNICDIAQQRCKMESKGIQEEASDNIWKNLEVIRLPWESIVDENNIPALDERSWWMIIHYFSVNIIWYLLLSLSFSIFWSNCGVEIKRIFEITTSVILLINELEKHLIIWEIVWITSFCFKKNTYLKYTHSLTMASKKIERKR